MTSLMPEHVAARYANFPPPAQTILANLRAMIFEEAARLRVGPLEETLKWNEPAYLTPVTKSGTTIRLGWSAKNPNYANIYVNCKTDLVGQISTMFPEAFVFHGTRCLSVRLDEPLPEVPIRTALGMALTYHRSGRPAKV